jgi:cell division protein FtsW (lipid II flippase)
MNNAADFKSESETLAMQLRRRSTLAATGLGICLVCLSGCSDLCWRADGAERKSDIASQRTGFRFSGASSGISGIVTWVVPGLHRMFHPTGCSATHVRLYAVLLFLLIVLLVPGIGSRVNGAQRWLRFAGLSLQPSELGRIVMPIHGGILAGQLRNTTGFGFKTVPRHLADAHPDCRSV